MKKLIKYTAAFILSFLFGMGLAKITKAQEASMLWKVSGNGLTSESYLYGTIHVACPDQVQLKQKVTDALSATSRVVFELDMDAPSLMTDMQTFSVSPNMKNIKEDLSEEQSDLLNDQLMQGLGAGLDQLGILKPFALYSAIMSTLPPCEQPYSFEEALMKASGKYGLPIEGLETVEEQFSFIEQISRAEQIGWITAMINDPEKYASDLSDLTNAYLQEDLKKLHALTVSNPEFSAFVELLIYKRNASWIPAIIDSMNDSPTFFAVGAAHLASEKGLIALLQKRGYTVEAVIK